VRGRCQVAVLTEQTGICRCCRFNHPEIELTGSATVWTHGVAIYMRGFRLRPHRGTRWKALREQLGSSVRQVIDSWGTGPRHFLADWREPPWLISAGPKRANQIWHLELLDASVPRPLQQQAA